MPWPATKTQGMNYGTKNSKVSGAFGTLRRFQRRFKVLEAE